MMLNRVVIFLVLLAGLSAKAYALEIKSWKTTNGVAVLFLESRNLPMVDFGIVFRAGSSRDSDLPGLSRLVNSLFIEGSGKLAAQQIAEQFEQVGARFRSGSGRDMARISLRSLSDAEKLNPVVDLLSRVIGLPAFPATALERNRNSMLINLAEQENRIGSLLAKTFMKNLYAGHPYQYGASGSEETLSRISRDDLIRFHRRYYVAENSTLAIVGDLSLREAKLYAEKLVRFLPRGKMAEKLPQPEQTRGKTIKVPFETRQTQIKIGMPLLSRRDPDFYALTLGNHILGGNGSNSRLMQKIREEKGLSYNVYSSLTSMDVAGPFQIGLQTRNHQVDEALALLDEELQVFIEKGPTEAELELAKKNITGGFAMRLDSNRKLLAQLTLIGFFKLPLDYLRLYSEKILALTAADIKRVFKRRIKPEQMIRVIVGPEQP